MLNDIIAAWDEVEYAKEASYMMVDSKGKWVRWKPTKNKVPEDPELVYAIFKARRKGMTFPQIFKLYQDGKLPLYTGTTNWLNSTKSLETYYNKYKPTT